MRQTPSVDALLSDTKGRSKREAKARAGGHATMASRGANVGSTEKMRQCLKEHGPLTTTQIADLTGIKFSTVKSLLSQSVTYGGGGFIVFDKKKGFTRYALPGAAPQPNVEKPVGEFATAMPAPIDRPFTELRRDPFIHWKLCDVTRGSTA